jgi:hypothetical protein
VEIVLAIAAAAAGSFLADRAPAWFGAARSGIPRFLGAFRLTYIRTAAGGVAGIALSAAIGLSTSAHSHEKVSYFFWYALALFGVVVALALSVVIDNKARREREKTRVQGLPALSDKEALSGDLGRRMRHDLKPRAGQPRLPMAYEQPPSLTRRFPDKRLAAAAKAIKPQWTTPAPVSHPNALVAAHRTRQAEERDPAAKRLRKVASEVHDFSDARNVEEPRQAGDLAAKIADPGDDYRTLEAYRKKTMAIYYERFRSEALAAFDDGFKLNAVEAEARAIVRQPDGTAALALVPDILRRSADRLSAS